MGKIDWSAPSRMGRKHQFMCYSKDLTLTFEVDESLIVPVQYQYCVGVALFCKECVDIWARVGPAEYGQNYSWVSRDRHCRKHGNGLLITHNIALCPPREILYHDFLVALEHEENNTADMNLDTDVFLIRKGLDECDRKKM